MFLPTLFWRGGPHVFGGDPALAGQLIFLIAVFVVGVLQALRAKSLRVDKAR